MQIINDRQLGGGMLWAVDLDTPDFALTRTLLKHFQSCPKDGEWPAASYGASITLPCPSGSGKEDNFQTRTCNTDGTWGVVSNLACQGIQMNSLAAQLCIQGI
ncbi:hypothetical protein HGRIS_010923 [Hohenbuehelia grisea]|uniref:G-protein coupled receptors family 2 profile 1 domain-containing protein n=1 Tax=Hohenbuehelia grisea TaxID=104357 RepID=A0ABR3IYA6_9AGAR